MNSFVGEAEVFLGIFHVTGSKHVQVEGQTGKFVAKFKVWRTFSSGLRWQSGLRAGRSGLLRASSHDLLTGVSEPTLPFLRCSSVVQGSEALTSRSIQIRTVSI